MTVAMAPHDPLTLTYCESELSISKTTYIAMRQQEAHRMSDTEIQLGIDRNE